MTGTALITRLGVLFGLWHAGFPSKDVYAARGCFNRVEETSRVTQLSLSSVTPTLYWNTIFPLPLSFPRAFSARVFSFPPSCSFFAAYPPRDVCGACIKMSLRTFCAESAFFRGGKKRTFSLFPVFFSFRFPLSLRLPFAMFFLREHGDDFTLRKRELPAKFLRWNFSRAPRRLDYFESRGISRHRDYPRGNKICRALNKDMLLRGYTVRYADSRQLVGFSNWHLRRERSFVFWST